MMGNMKKGLFINFRFKNIRFRERMLLIYIIGGIIPFLLAILYSNARSRTIMLDQTKEAEMEEISLICSSISQSMRVAEQASEHIYGDEEVRQIISRLKNKEYKNQEEFDRDCREMDFIDEYLDYFQENIADIKIYVENMERTSNRYITFVDSDTMKSKHWYNYTSSYEGKPFWSYDLDSRSMQNKMQLTRCIPNEKGGTLGILQIVLEMNEITEKLSKREVGTVILFENEEVIARNFQIGKAEEHIISGLNALKKTEDSRLMEYQNQRHLLTYQRIYGSSSREYYTVSSIQDYRDIMSNVSRTNFVSLTTVAVGLMISVGLILLFSILFENRIQILFQQMHRVATGEYDQVEPLEGTDEIGLIYGELEQMMREIQVLTEQVVEEQVQKERLHTRQKEVEFKMLADQINPHFIYNTLETIRMKAKMNRQPEIEELVKMLAKIMRRNIQAGPQMVTLGSELELTENYLVIQKYRFGDRISSRVEVERDVDLSCMVIPLIMQPFVENAFVHGLESVDGKGMLGIHVMMKGEEISIIIEDNGAGISPASLAEIQKELREGAASESRHVGINNVNQRIRIKYGEEYGVTVDSQIGRGTRITLRFPANLPAISLE